MDYHNTCTVHVIASKVAGKILVVLKAGRISETGKAMPTKIGLHTFHVYLYLHKFFEPILFFDPHGL